MHQEGTDTKLDLEQARFLFWCKIGRSESSSVEHNSLQACINMYSTGLETGHFR